MKRLLLVSSSKTHGTGFLDHCAGAISKHLVGVERVLFFPYALADHDAYAYLARSRLGEMGFRVDSIHEVDDPLAAVERAQAVFVGGGNTFRLLKTLYDQQLLEPLRQRALQGIPYIGSSAGTNMACPTIRTSNDMPIVEPPGFSALHLIPFQINPHFIDADLESKHQGEKREQRLREFLEENESSVLAIREGCWLLVHGNTCLLQGETGAVLFRRDHDPLELPPGTTFGADGIHELS